MEAQAAAGIERTEVVGSKVVDPLAMTRESDAAIVATLSAEHARLL